MEKHFSREYLDKITKAASYVDVDTWNETNQYADQSDIYDILYEMSNNPDGDYAFTIKDHEEQGAPEGKTVVGLVIADGDQTDWPKSAADLNDLISQAEQMGLDRDKLQLIIGTRMS